VVEEVREGGRLGALRELENHAHGQEEEHRVRLVFQRDDGTFRWQGRTVFTAESKRKRRRGSPGIKKRRL
jgi:hypothetical protein